MLRARVCQTQSRTGTKALSKGVPGLQGLSPAGQSPGWQDAEAGQGQGTETQEQNPEAVRETEGNEKVPEVSKKKKTRAATKGEQSAGSVCPKEDRIEATAFGGPKVMTQVRKDGAEIRVQGAEE